MAITQNTYTGNGSTVLFSFTFPYLETTDIKVSVNGAITTAYTLANATTVQFNTAPANGAAIRIYRETDDSALTATFYPGSAIRSQDLNSNFTQSLYVAQEVNNYTLKDTGNVSLLANYSFLGSVTFSQPPVGPTPVNSNHLATKAYVDTFVKDVGSLILTATYSFTQPVTVGTPTSSGHAATKSYVDTYVTGLGNLTSGNKGDITVAANLTTWTVNASSITTSMLANSSVTTAKLADGSVTTSKLNFVPVGRGFVYFTSSF